MLKTQICVTRPQYVKTLCTQAIACTTTWAFSGSKAQAYEALGELMTQRQIHFLKSRGLCRSCNWKFVLLGPLYVVPEKLSFISNKKKWHIFPVPFKRTAWGRYKVFVSNLLHSPLFVKTQCQKFLLDIPRRQTKLYLASTKEKSTILRVLLYLKYSPAIFLGYCSTTWFPTIAPNECGKFHMPGTALTLASHSSSLFGI